jgi:hypothetical protein
MPILTVGASGLDTGRPSMQFTNAGAVQNLTSGAHGDAILQPYCHSVFQIRRGGFTDSVAVSGSNGTYPNIGWDTTANQFAIYAGTNVFGTATASAWHAFNVLFNGASSSVMVDGTNNTGLNPGTNNIGTDQIFIAAADISGASLTGDITEFGLASSNISGSFSTIQANQVAYWT